MSLRYVVVVDHVRPDRETLHSYWYGPKHGWGTTAGGAGDRSVALFVSRSKAEDALRAVYGNLAEAQRRGYRVVRTDKVGVTLAVAP